MRASAPVLAVALAAALAGCGDTLVDHRNVGIQDDGGGSVCLGGDISCQVNPSPELPTCVPEDALHCGACLDCTVGFTPPHAAAVPACSTVPGAAGSGVCDYECTGGLLKCPLGSGCCSATAVVAGVAHSCAVTSDGTLACWGANAQGQVTGSASLSPVSVPIRRPESGVVAVAAGEAHTCAALANEIHCWGRNVELQAPSKVEVAGATALAAGLTHTCALAGGNVHCWGRGQAVATVAGVAGATAIAAGTDHTCALVAGGVKCWGANAAGQLGDGSTTPSASPVDAQGLGSGIVAIAAGGDHTCAAAQTPVEVAPGVEDGVRCWGDAPGGSFLLPPPQTTPGIPMKDSNTSVIRFEVTALATGRSHVCVQRVAAEAIRCFGPANEAGQLGGVPATATELNDVPGSPGATSFAAGGDHACAAFADGGVRCWGSNAQGQLGDGSTITPGVGGDPRTLGSPVQVSGG